MLNNLLWALHTKQMYNMQKAQGAAGLIGLIIVFVSVWKWNDWLYPLLNQIGLVSLANDIGLVHDYGVITVINVFLMIALSTIVIGLVLLTVIFFITFLGSIFKTKMFERIVSFISAMLMVVLAVGFFIPLFFYVVLSPKYSKGKSDKSTDSTNPLQYLDDYKVWDMEPFYKQGLSRKINLDFNNYEDQNIYSLELYKALTEGTDYVPEPLSTQEARNKLQRIMPASPDGLMMGYNKVHRSMMILLPNPLPPMGSSCISMFEPQNIDFNFNVESSLYFAQKKNQMPSHYYLMGIKASFLPMSKGILPVANSMDSLSKVSLSDFSHIYYLTDDHSLEEMNELISDNKYLNTYLKNAHLAYYVLPIILRYNQNEQLADDFMKMFYQEWSQTADAERYFSDYAADVEKYVRACSDMGESWAKN